MSTELSGKKQNNMKICLIIDDYLPHSIKIGAKMMHELGVQFVKMGHSVIVITPDTRLNKRFEITEIEGVTVCRFRSGEIKNVSKVKRAINETLLSYRAWQACKDYLKQSPCDLIVYYSPSIFWGLLVSKLKSVWGASSYLVLRDFFPQWVIDTGLLKEQSLITSYFRFFEWLNYRAADTIGIQPPKNLPIFAKNTHTNKPLTVLYNWAALEAITHVDNHYRKQLGLENKIVYFYGGNIGHAQDMMNIVRLAKAMRTEPRAHFVMVGNGDEFELVQKAISQEDLHNMTLLPAVSQDEFKNMLAEFDIGLFSLHPDHSSHNIPGKLLGYMVQEKPILGSINPDNDLKDIVEQANAGLISVNGDDNCLLDNALKLLHDESFRKTTGENAKQLLRDTFSVEAAAKHILLSLSCS